MNTKTRGDTIGDVEVKAIHKTFAKTLAHPKVKTLGDTLGDVESEALVDTMAYTLAWARQIDTSTHLAI